MELPSLLAHKLLCASDHLYQFGINKRYQSKRPDKKCPQTDRPTHQQTDRQTDFYIAPIYYVSGGINIF